LHAECNDKTVPAEARKWEGKRPRKETSSLSIGKISNFSYVIKTMMEDLEKQKMEDKKMDN